MIEKMFIQIIGIILVGNEINKLMIRVFSIRKTSSIDRVITSIVLGYASFILPMLIVGIFLDGKMHYVVYSHYLISLLLILKYILLSLSNYHNMIIRLPKLPFAEKFFILAIGGVSGLYLFYMIIYYERGWDALHFYFPNALYFYITNDIPQGFNPFSFFPTFKPPLNTLFITYSMYVTNGYQKHTWANIHPWILMMGTLLVIIAITQDLTDSKLTSYFTGFTFLVTPLTYFLIYEFAYYQDIPVMFFMITTFYYVSKIKIDETYYLSTLAAFSASLAILSKMSGYTIIYLIVLSFSIKLPGNSDKILKSIMFFILTVFLARNTAYDHYAGYAFVVIIIGIYTGKLIMKNNQLSINKSNVIVISSIPLIIGTIWLLFMLKIPRISDFLIKSYVTTESRSIKTVFNGISNPYTVYIENGMQVSFMSSIFYIFTGSTMGLFYVIPKIHAFFKVKFDIDEKNRLFTSMKLYTLGFFILWMTYYARTSARYLTPILPMLTIFTCIGLVDLLKRYNIYEERVLSKFLFSISGTFFVYPFLPLENVFLNPNLRIYFYHKNQWVLFLYIVVSLIIFIKLIKSKIKISKIRYKRYSYISLTLFILIFSAPQMYFYINSGFNTDKFNEEINYPLRANFQELIDKIIELNIAPTHIIMSVNTPGLEYYVTRPVADLMFISITDEIGAIESYNSSESLQFMKDNNITLIVKLNVDHVYYSIYIDTFAKMPIYKIVSDGNEFSLIMENNEFILYQRNT